MSTAKNPCVHDVAEKSRNTYRRCPNGAGVVSHAGAPKHASGKRRPRTAVAWIKEGTIIGKNRNGLYLLLQQALVHKEAYRFEGPRTLIGAKIHPLNVHWDLL